MEVYGVIYKITNNINNKCYIGQTTRKNGFDERYNYNFKKYCHNEYLKRAIDKCGIENFTIDKEFYIAYSKDELNQKETELIKQYKSDDFEYGYNMKSGGDNGKPSSKTKLKILENQNIKPIYCKTTNEIFLCSKDVEKKYGIGRKNIINQCNGIKLKYRKNTFYNHKLNKYLEFEYYNHSKNSKPIICITTNQIFKSISVAEKSLNINKKTLSSSFRYNKDKDKKVITLYKNSINELKFMYLFDYVVANY